MPLSLEFPQDKVTPLVQCVFDVAGDIGRAVGCARTDPTTSRGWRACRETPPFTRSRDPDGPR
ncbi:MAG: hypothetical protein FJW09_03990 [Actinobacteria bacterium]|nr:hypothetical protein [Actinomycetota bacterium]